MSFSTEGQLTTDKKYMKLAHMLINLFPVCAYAAINYENGRRLEYLIIK